MVKLNIKEFTDYNRKAIYEFLHLLDEKEFQIIIPRETIATAEDRYIIVTEFISAAYSGQLLCEFANTFAYWVPSPYIPDDFCFEVTITDLEKFADLLYQIIRGNDYLDTHDEFLNFENAAADFMTDAFDAKIICNTWGLVHIANEFME